MEHHQRTVVVGVDGSPEALEAVRFALLEAQTLTATLILAHAIDLGPADAPYPPEYLTSRREESLGMLREVQLELPVGTTPVRLMVATTTPAALLTGLSSDGDLVVVGDRHQGPLGTLLGGTVSGPLAERAQCPVLVVPQGWTAQGATGRPVVVALDHQMCARSALDLAFASARRLQVDLVVLHPDGWGTHQWLLDDDQDDLMTIVAAVELDYPGVVVRPLRLGTDAERAILAAAGVAGLLVVGRPNGDPEIGSWTRSAADAVLQQVRCPVAVIPGARAAGILSRSPATEVAV